MIKNPEILKKLNLDEKISLIADANNLFNQGNAKAGIRRVNTASWDEVNTAEGNIYPAFTSLANTWNADLISEVAADIASRAKKRSVNLLFSPEIRVKSNPYVNGVSEDPYFVRSCAYNLTKAIKSAGVTPCITGCAVRNSDVKYLDEKMDLRTVREYFFNPYKALSAFDDGVVTMTSYTKLAGSYSDVNCEILSNMLTTIADKRNGYVICGEADADLSVQGVMKHTLSVGGNPSAVRQAMVNYDGIKEAMNTGDASGTDLEAALRDFSAVSEESIDEAADRVISFSEYCNGGSATASPKNPEQLALNAAVESIVLLKNSEGVLPLKRKKVAIIGEPAQTAYSGESFSDYFSRNCGNEGVEVIGSAKGYNLSGERSEALINEAAELAKQADAVLVFLGLDNNTEERLVYSSRVKLPANRLALIDALNRQNAKVIAILTTGCSVDMSFDEKLSAVMVAPLGHKNGNDALTDILLGVSNPSGRLTFTYYNDTDNYFTRLKNYKNSGRVKVGGFIGYRYYDAAGTGAKYPFGHGLSYTDFSYSNLSVNDDTVEVTVKNVGRYAGSEVVQLYIGKTGTAVIRPLKELKDYKKVFLLAGESKVVKFKISSKLLAVYDEQRRRNVTEDGQYEIYIASSVSDVKLQGKIQVEGETVNRDNKRHSDYFMTVSNVLTDGYTLKSVKLAGNKGKPQIACGLIGMGLSLLCLGVLIALNALGVFENVFNGEVIMGLEDNQMLAVCGLALCIIFTVFAVVFIAGIALWKRAKENALTVSARAAAMREQPQHPFEILFNEEFKADEPAEEKKELPKEEFDEDSEALKYTDPSLTLETACRQLLAYSRSCGIKLETVDAAKILAAFASSRLILLRSRNSALLPELIKVLSGYFCTDSYIDEFKDYKSFDDLMVNNCAAAVNAAQSVRQNVHIAGLTNVDVRSVRTFFTPLLKYVLSPASSGTIKYGYDKKLNVSPNVWFVFALAEKSVPGADDTYILNSAAYVDVQISKCAPAAEKSAVRFFSYYQLQRMADSLAEKFPLGEDKGWKKIDKLEKYVNAHTPYRIGNKLWLRTEKFASAILACGAPQSVALDCTAASVLLASIICQLKGKINAAEESLVNVIYGIFGEESIPECKKILNGFGLSAV